MSWISILEFGSSLLAGWQRILIYTLLAASIGIAIFGYGYMKGSEKGIALEASVEAVGKVALEAAKAAKKRNDAVTQAKDKEHEKRTAALNLTIARLRNDANRSILPPAPSGSRRPDLACFDRGELDAALRAYRQGIAGLVSEGAAATLDLDTSKAWWSEISR